jgi:hypothetical protein
MAEIKTISIEDDTISVNLNVSKEEYNLLKEDTKNLVVLPTAKLNELLTTGTIGNSNRIMLPNKLLRKNSIKKLLKHVNARIFEVNAKKLLLIKLEDIRPGVPQFEEDNS